MNWKDVAFARIPRFTRSTGSIPARNAMSVQARYIIPVSTNRYPSKYARAFPTEVLPEAAGPSIAITLGNVMAKSLLARGSCVNDLLLQ